MVIILDNNELMYHLAEISVNKLTQKPKTLRNQLLIKNVLVLLLENQSIQEEQSWLDSCFHKLEDENMEESTQQDNLLVITIPFNIK